MKKRPKTTSFAETVREVRDRPELRPEKRRPGLHGSLFVDNSRREYVLADPAVTPERALETARGGALIVWDSCGCGGGCGWDWCSHTDVAEMVRSGPPVIGGARSRRGELMEFRAADGPALLVVIGDVTWSRRLA